MKEESFNNAASVGSESEEDKSVGDAPLTLACINLMMMKYPQVYIPTSEQFMCSALELDLTNTLPLFAAP